MKKALLEKSAAMGIPLSVEQAEMIERFHRMLVEKNKSMNLTAVTEDSEAVDRHYLDSLSPLKFSLLNEGDTAIDVGTGAGFPGIPLLIALPGLRLTLMDSLKKRLVFLEEALKELELDANIVHARAEDLGRDQAHREQYDFALARAVAGGSTLLEYLLPFVRVGGSALLWKGPQAMEEISAHCLEALHVRPLKLYPYEIPGRDWRHVLVLAGKAKQTAPAYPRKAGTPLKKPL